MSLRESDGWIVGRQTERLPSGGTITWLKMSPEWHEAMSEAMERGRREARAAEGRQVRRVAAFCGFLVLLGLAARMDNAMGQFLRDFSRFLLP